MADLTDMSGNGTQIIYVDASSIKGYRPGICHGAVPVATTSSGNLVPVAAESGQGPQIIPQPQQQEEEGPEINIDINNVVSSFSVRCHLNLKKIAMEGANVIYKRENGVSR